MNVAHYVILGSNPIPPGGDGSCDCVVSCDIGFCSLLRCGEGWVLRSLNARKHID